MSSSIGDTALTVLVPEANEIVGPWRDRYDPPAGEGMPAHVTVLYPFVRESKIDPTVLELIASLSSRHDPFQVTFRRFGHFPEVLWLDPESQNFVELLHDARRTWPNCLPYGRSDLQVIPHLTITDGANLSAQAEAEEDVKLQLPLTAEIGALSLMAFDGKRWCERQQFTLGENLRRGID
jgi:2'-5' RNA ligase